MGCCGKGRRPTSRRKSGGGAGGATLLAKSNPGLPGQEGMTLLEYKGRNLGTETFFGPATGQTYQFGGSKRLGYVDDRDLRSTNQRTPGLLDVREYGQALFGIYQPKPEIEVSKADAQQVNPPAGEAPRLIATAEEAAPAGPELSPEEEDRLMTPHEPDDLTQIGGLGAATARKLNDAGISGFAELRDADAVTLSEQTGISLERLTAFQEEILNRGLA